MKSQFIVRRNVFGVLTVVFAALSFWMSVQTICGSPMDDVGTRAFARCVIVMPFALPALLFAWRFVIWHKRANSF